MANVRQAPTVTLNERDAGIYDVKCSRCGPVALGLDGVDSARRVTGSHLHGAFGHGVLAA